MRKPYGKLGRRDANEAAIVDALRGYGCTVYRLHDPCDLAVGWRKRTLFLEVKNPNKPPSARKLTAEQIEFRDTWRGHWAVVTTPEDALHAVISATLI